MICRKYKHKAAIPSELIAKDLNHSLKNQYIRTCTPFQEVYKLFIYLRWNNLIG